LASEPGAASRPTFPRPALLVVAGSAVILRDPMLVRVGAAV
jgi:hypothetical protein